MIPITVCIIGKNEEQHMENCLAPLAAYPFEIIYVDTGSEDKTKEIAAKHHAKIYDFAWIDDFSAARNFAMSKASHNMVLFLDCDEYLRELDETAFYEIAETHGESVGCLLRNNCFEENGTPTNYPDRVERLFSKDRFHYTGVIHEQIVTLADDSPLYERYDLPLTVDHAGCSDRETLRKKVERNNELLFRELKKKPEDPYLYFQIGQSYNAIRDYENAYMNYKKSFALPLNPYEPWVKIMAVAYLNALNHTGRSREAVRFFEPIYAHFADNADFYCGMGSAYRNLHPPKPLNAMAEYLKALQCQTARETGANTFIPCYHIGLINEMMGKPDIALAYYERAAELGFTPAKEKLQLLRKEDLTV